MKLILGIFLISFNAWLIADSTLDGAKLTQQYCSECHGKDGNSQKENIPKIAGFSSILLFDILDQFKNGDRPSPKTTINNKTTDMTEVSKLLTQDQIETISLYLSTQTFKPTTQPFNQALAGIGKQLHQDLCKDCHGDNGKSAVDDAPILAGQWKQYLKQQFENLSSHKRYMPKRMKRKFKKLNDKDKQALIEFYASPKIQLKY